MNDPNRLRRVLGSVPVKKSRKTPVWKGPEEDGITFSLLSRFLVCRERFRLLTVEGLKAREDFSHRLEFGNMWHACEESLSAGWSGDGNLQMLTEYAQTLLHKFPTRRDQVSHCYGIVQAMFPVYVDYWRKHPDVKAQTPLIQEGVFDVPYRLPSDRTVRLRGKWDAVHLEGKAVVLQENKTKSDVDELQIARQMSFDLQTMIYLVAWEEFRKTVEGDKECQKYGVTKAPTRGVRYNVIKRPRQYQGKRETADQFYDRLRGIVAEKPEEFFHRWKVDVSKGDIDRFRTRCLDPILELLCDWWNAVKNRPDPFTPGGRGSYNSIHYQYPFGVYNPLLEGGSSDHDEYLESGSEAGLQRTDNLFPELT